MNKYFLLAVVIAGGINFTCKGAEQPDLSLFPLKTQTSPAKPEGPSTTPQFTKPPVKKDKLLAAVSAAKERQEKKRIEQERIEQERIQESLRIKAITERERAEEALREEIRQQKRLEEIELAQLSKEAAEYEMSMKARQNEKAGELKKKTHEENMLRQKQIEAKKVCLQTKIQSQLESKDFVGANNSNNIINQMLSINGEICKVNDEITRFGARMERTSDSDNFVRASQQQEKYLSQKEKLIDMLKVLLSHQ